jgi:predicted transcriptional regulator
MTPHQKASKQHVVFQRRLRVAELAAQGRTQLEIALELGVSQPTICADLNEIHAQWRQAAEAETADRIAREIAMIEQIRRAAWQGWERSQQDQERKRVKTTAGPDQDSGVKVERTKERRTQSGDSKMLQTALKCSEMILRTLGAFKPKPTPPVNTWDTVLKTLYESQANGDAEDHATRIERRVKEMPAGAEAKAEDERLAPQRVDGREWRVEQPGGMPTASVCELSPGCSRMRNPGEIAGDVASHGEKEPGAREEDAETPTPAAPVSPATPVSDAEPGAGGSCSSRQAGGFPHGWSSRQAGGLPHGAETPTSAAPVSADAEPGAQVPPGKEQTPKALGTYHLPEGWLTARRGWNRIAG